MRAFIVTIGRRLRFEAMAPSSCDCVMQHMGLLEDGECIVVRPLRRAA